MNARTHFFIFLSDGLGDYNRGRVDGNIYIYYIYYYILYII